MLRHFISTINYKKLIEMQANQISFAPLQTKNGKTKPKSKLNQAKVKTYKREKRIK